MLLNIRSTEERVEKYYETIDLKNNVQLERLTTETYVGNDINYKSKTIQTYYKNNKVEHGIIALFDKNIKECHRQHNIFQTKDDVINKASYEYIDNVPFDLVLEKGDNWEEYFDLLIFSSYDHTLRSLDNKELPKRIYFDYMNGITNEYFDLEELLKHLKTIKSVELLSKIKSVPYYNNEDGCREEIEFYLRPTDEEWDEILSKEIELKYQNDAIIKYYGLDKFRINS